MALSQAARAVLANADPAAVLDAFSYMRRYMNGGRWLGLKNAYAADTIRQLETDIGPPSTVNSKHLVEYIAASVPLHLIDGWSYLGRALSAHLLGDVHAARHLAYYAELRGAMSLLASQGIGVFNRQHLVTVGRATATHVPTQSGTHVFAWDALQWWADQPASASVIGAAIRPYQRDIATWLASADPTYNTWAAQARDWVLKLGLDLNRLANDRSSRNEASYRPTRIRTPGPSDVRGDTEFAISLWLSLEPTPSGFERLDRHFLRISFEAAFAAAMQPAPTSAPFGTAVSDLLTSNDVHEPRRSYLQEFLVRHTEANDLLLIRNALVSSATNHSQHHLHVLSRATLLLVISSLVTRSFISRATVGLVETDFWWNLLGTDRGLWANHEPPHDLRDYWEDIQVDLDDLQTWLDAGGDQRATLVSTCPRSLTRLGQLELVGLWGIAA